MKQDLSSVHLAIRLHDSIQTSIAVCIILQAPSAAESLRRDELLEWWRGGVQCHGPLLWIPRSPGERPGGTLGGATEALVYLAGARAPSRRSVPQVARLLTALCRPGGKRPCIPISCLQAQLLQMHAAGTATHIVCAGNAFCAALKGAGHRCG